MNTQERSLEMERNMWREYAMELEWKLEEITNSYRRKHTPQMDGQRLVISEGYADRP